MLLRERQGLHGDPEFRNKARSGAVDPVTPMDLKADAMLREELPRILPLPVVSEEMPGEGGDLYWLVDPLDGTNNYMNDLPFYAVSVALVQGKKPLAGVVYAPALKKLFLGARGKGAYLGKERLKVSSRPQPLWLVELATQPSSPEELRYLLPLLGKVRAFRVFGAMALSLAYTAAGRIDLFLGSGSPWDIAAGMVILEEAGGVLRTLSGKERELPEKVWSAGGPPEVVEAFLHLEPS